MRTIALCFLLLSAADTFRSTVIAQARVAKETHWAWVHTGPLFDSWEAITGKAIVTVEGASGAGTLSDGAVTQFGLTRSLPRQP